MLNKKIFDSPRDLCSVVWVEENGFQKAPKNCWIQEEMGRGSRWRDREGQKRGKEIHNQRGLGKNPIKSADLL